MLKFLNLIVLKEKYSFNYVGSMWGVGSVSAQPTPPARACLCAQPLRARVGGSSGPVDFRTACLECRFFPGRINWHRQCREVLRLTWPDHAPSTQSPPEQPPPSAAACDGGAPCAATANTTGRPSLAPVEGGAGVAPAAGEGLGSRTRCWKCSEAHSHRGWRHCREVLKHTEPDTKARRAARLAARMGRGADTVAGGGCGTAEVTAVVEPATSRGATELGPWVQVFVQQAQVPPAQLATHRHPFL
jgi:hypothetical protein